MAAAERPAAVVPKAPPSDVVSSAKQKMAPNWALKTVMAATGALLALMLVIRLIVNLWFFAGSDHFDAVTQRVHEFLGPYLPPDAWLWIIRIVAIGLIVLHIGLAIVLVMRAKRGRGPIPAKLHGGMPAWLTKLMPHTGVVIALFALFYVLDQIAHVFVPLSFPASGGAGTISSYAVLSGSLQVPWIAVVYVVGLLAIAAHVLHGLGTAAAIAAGNGRFAGNVTRIATIVCGAVFGALLLANIAIVLCVVGGWL